MTMALGVRTMNLVNSCRTTALVWFWRHIKPHERFFIPNSYDYWTNCFLGLKGRTAVAVRKGIPQNYIDLPPIVSVEATGVCIPIGSSEISLQLSKNLWVTPGLTQTSLCSYVLDKSLYWQVT
jgi:hypothetical protein